MSLAETSEDIVPEKRSSVPLGERTRFSLLIRYRYRNVSSSAIMRIRDAEYLRESGIADIPSMGHRECALSDRGKVTLLDR